MSDRPKETLERIEELRGKIDGIDRDIVRLLNERAGFSLAIRDLKPKVDKSLYDPKREEEIFLKLAEANGGPLFNDSLREIYEVLLHVMKEL